MFYFQKLLSQGMSGIDGTAMISTAVGVGYAILLVGFLVGLYQAAMRGGDLQALGVSAIKYLVVAIILANWSTLFRDVNNSFNQVAHLFDSSSGAVDMFATWMDQLSQQFSNLGFKDLWPMITAPASTAISEILIVVAYILYGLMVIIFAFFYTLYGCLLYVLGPIILAVLPISGVGRLAKNYAENLMIWNMWGVIYAIFGSLITAIQMSRINDIFSSSGFMGFMTGGPIDSFMLGLISIVYALALGLVPFIAKQLVSGDVGATAHSVVRAGAQLAGVALSIISGSVAAGAAAGAGSGSGGAGSGSGARAGSGAAGGGAGGNASGAGTSAMASSSSPPPQPSLANTIISGVQSAFRDDSAPTATSNGSSSQSSPSNNGGASGSSRNGSSKTTSGGNGNNGQRSSGGQTPYVHKPVGPTQTLAYHAARLTTQAAQGSKQTNGGEEAPNNDDKNK